MRLMINDFVKLSLSPAQQLVGRVANIRGNGNICLAPHNEANVDARNRDRADPFGYVSKMAGSLQKAQGRRVTISPIGELRDPGFSG